MEQLGPITLLLIISNVWVTYKGLKEIAFLDKFSFIVEQILVNKDYKRLISSGFLHVNWTHFAFNMITLYLFSQGLEASIGIQSFLILYFVSLIGGNLFALYIHRNHSDYSAIGASGAVSGLVFASIGLFPGMKIGFIFLPIQFPAWLFGLAYVLYSIYGIKTQKDNIGHEAHLGGGIVGLLIAICLYPNILTINYIPILLILIPSLIFIILILRNPHLLLVPNPFSKQKGVRTIEDKYNLNRAEKQNELDSLLDKISKKGIENLSEKEKIRLDELSK